MSLIGNTPTSPFGSKTSAPRGTAPEPSPAARATRADAAASGFRPPAAQSRSQYAELKANVHRRLLNRLNLEALATADRARAEGEIRTLMMELLAEENTPLSLAERDALSGELLDEVFGLGPLEPLLRDPSVSDIIVNTYRHVFVERGGMLERVSTSFQDDRHLLRVIDRIVSGVGRRVDDSSPMVDARLPDGSRVNAIIPPLAVDGPLLSIRRFPAERLKADDLVTLRALTKPMLDFLEHSVRARLNAIISGGTGAGKTTLLNVLSSFIGERERIVTIEDAAELQLHQEHVARLETRPPNVEGKGAVRQRQLVVNALRMRPDRIIVGEVRSEESLDMLQAMNTGHDGSLTTVHANSPRDALSRIETMIAMGATNLPERAIRQQIASAIQIVVQQTRLSDGSRKVTSISEITGMEGDVITMQEIFVFDKMGVTQDGKVVGRFRATGVRPKCCERLRASGIHLPGDMFEGVTEVR
jgi:pilus assembly protein CpaF